MNNMHTKMNLEAQEPRYEAPALDVIKLTSDANLCIAGSTESFNEEEDYEIF